MDPRKRSAPTRRPLGIQVRPAFSQPSTGGMQAWTFFRLSSFEHRLPFFQKRLNAFFEVFGGVAHAVKG